MANLPHIDKRDTFKEWLEKDNAVIDRVNALGDIEAANAELGTPNLVTAIVETRELAIAISVALS